MAQPLRQLRRAATQTAIRNAIAATARLPPGAHRPIVRSLVEFAGSMLRSRVRESMRLALGDDVPAWAGRTYFRHLGWHLSSSLSAFHHGIAATPVPQEVNFDESVSVLDDAIAEGRGAVLTSPHWIGHELVAAVINNRHPMVMFIRQTPAPERALRKQKWYAALGTETVLRPNRTSTMEDAVAYLRVLKRGKMLAITPDLLAGPREGVEACIFGRPVRLHGGAFAIATLAKAPLIRVSGQWQSDSTIQVTFDRAPLDLGASNRDAIIRAGVQDWCRWFEAKLRANPENWQFWLDRRWSRFLRETPRQQCAP